MKCFIATGGDEFNGIILANLMLMDLKEKVDVEESYTSIPPAFDCMFPDITKTLTYGFRSEKLNEFLQQNNSLEKICAENLFEKYCPEYLGSHIYRYTFRAASKYIQTQQPLIQPKERDYLEVKESLKNISKPIICIHGRNLPKHPMRNLLLKDHIKKLLEMGAYVINVTTESPKFNLNNDNYLEVDTTWDFSYSKKISYFLNSNCVLIAGNGGGVNVHILTQSNMCILNNSESWVIGANAINRESILYNGLDSIEARKQFTNMQTITTPMNYIGLEDRPIDVKILERCLTFDKPKVTNFFDETKIIG